MAGCTCKRSLRQKHIHWPLTCGRCGVWWPGLFMVPDRVWEYYIPKQHRRDVICPDCWAHIVDVADGGAYQAKFGGPQPILNGFGEG